MEEGSKPNSPEWAGPGFFLTFTSILPTGIKVTTVSPDWDPAAHGHQPHVLCSPVCRSVSLEHQAVVSFQIKIKVISLQGLRIDV